MKCPDCKGEKVYIPLIGSPEDCRKCQGSGVVDLEGYLRPPGDSIEQGKYHAWYSASAAQVSRLNVYQRLNGERVVITEVVCVDRCERSSEKPIPIGSHKDYRYCGRVEKHVQCGFDGIIKGSQFRDDEDPRNGHG
jgi:hypothetical protein